MINGNIIYGMESQLTLEEALRELIENAEAAAATKIHFSISPGSFTVSDNGVGIRNLNLITTPGESETRSSSKGTGTKGVGAYQALAHFGRRWLIHSVREGSYRRYLYEVKPGRPLPRDHSGQTLPLHQAPAEIRSGGTIITVTQRQEGLGEVQNFDRLMRNLEATYRPALKNKFSITVEMPLLNLKRQITETAVAGKFSSVPLTIRGAVKGLGFSVRYATLKKYDEILSGAHFIYGPRVMANRTALGQITLPPAVFMDVVLDPDVRWKDLFSTNKSRVPYEKELLEELVKLLGRWIKQQKEKQQSIRINLMNGMITGPINQKLAWLLRDKKGSYGPVSPKPKEKVEEEIEEEIEEEVEEEETKQKRKSYRRRRRAQKGTGGYGAEIEPVKNTFAVSLTLGDLGTNLYQASLSPTECAITLNRNPDYQQYILSIYGGDKDSITFKDIAPVMDLMLMIFSGVVADNPQHFKLLFENLRKEGKDYTIDEGSKRAKIMAQVSNYLVNTLGVSKVSRQPIAEAA